MATQEKLSKLLFAHFLGKWAQGGFGAQSVNNLAQSLCAILRPPGDSRPVFVDRLSRPKSSKFMRFGYDATTLARCAFRNGQVAAEVHFKTRHNINLDPHSLHNFRIFEATA